MLLLADEPTGALDSHSTAEVLALFDELNADGRTIVVITHEDEVAHHAKRVVRLRDGGSCRPAVVAHEPPPGGRRRPGERPGGACGSPWRGVASNKLRSVLTMLGILIGVAAVIILVAVGNGSSTAVQDPINALGTNTLTVTASSTAAGRRSAARAGRRGLRLGALRRWARQAAPARPGVRSGGERHRGPASSGHGSSGSAAAAGHVTTAEPTPALTSRRQALRTVQRPTSSRSRRWSTPRR